LDQGIVLTGCSSNRVTATGKVQAPFDSAALKEAIKKIILKQGEAEDALLKDPGNRCRV
jgi:hypothetical protein